MSMLNFDIDRFLRIEAGALALAPAIQASRPDMVSELKERTTLPGGTRWYNARHLLVSGQVALSLVALVSAGREAGVTFEGIVVEKTVRRLTIAGFPPVLVHGASGSELFRAEGPPLGIVPGMPHVAFLLIAASVLVRQVQRRQQVALLQAVGVV